MYERLDTIEVTHYVLCLNNLVGWVTGMKVSGGWGIQ